MSIALPAPTRPVASGSPSAAESPAASPHRLPPRGVVHREDATAHAALRAAVAEFRGTRVRTARDSQETDRWVGEGGARCRGRGDDGRIHRRDRRAWEAHEHAHDHVYQAVAAFARALHRDAIGLPDALVTVRATVGDGARGLEPMVLAALQRDAAQCCLEAFIAH